jgi:flagellin
MASYINTNLASLNAQRNLSSSQSALQTSLQRLSSGLRVNSAKDDAAGLAIASRLESNVRGMNQAARNASDGISLAQTAEGALGAIQTNLQRMRELAVQGANATAANDIASITNEYTQLAAENTRVIAATQFNKVDLLATASTQTFQIGASDVAANDRLDVTIGVIAMTSTTFTDNATALAEITKLDADIKVVADTRATFGAVQSRFESIISNLQIAAENQAAAKSRIMDTDYAQETANLTRAQILQQAGTAMLAQANQSPNTVLTLLR